MPSTITSFITFVANTKARASQVNTNFSNFRGTRLPINSDTISASNQIHDLGSDEHRWNKLFAVQVDFDVATTTATTLVQGQAFTAGGLEVLISGNTVAAIGPSGIQRGSLEQNFILTSATTVSGTGALSLTANHTITTSGGLLHISLVPAENGGTVSAVQNFVLDQPNSAPGAIVRFYRDSTIMAQIQNRMSIANPTTTSFHSIPYGEFWIVNQLSAGTYTFRAEAQTSNNTMTANNVRLFVREL